MATFHSVQTFALLSPPPTRTDQNNGNPCHRVFILVGPLGGRLRAAGALNASQRGRLAIARNRSSDL